MKKLMILAAGLLAAAQLTACTFPAERAETAGSGQKDAVTMEETAESEEVMESGEGEEMPETAVDSAEGAGEEPDLETALFWSMGSTVQMEITTGLTTEYLANLCAFPVTVHINEEEIVLETEEDLEELGLDALYTDGLLEAVKNCDIEKQKIQNGRMVVGDDFNCVVLEMEDSGSPGIKEFYLSGK